MQRFQEYIIRAFITIPRVCNKLNLHELVQTLKSTQIVSQAVSNTSQEQEVNVFFSANTEKAQNIPGYKSKTVYEKELVTAIASINQTDITETRLIAALATIIKYSKYHNKPDNEVIACIYLERLIKTRTINKKHP